MNWKSEQEMPSREQQGGSRRKKKDSRHTGFQLILTLEMEILFGIFEKRLR